MRLRTSALAFGSVGIQAVLMCLLVFSGLFAFAAPPPNASPAQARDKNHPDRSKNAMNANRSPNNGNVIKAIRSSPYETAPNGLTIRSGVEIELYSPRSFPVGNERVVLKIGKQQFTRSRSPDDGTLNTLFFLLPAQAFARAVDGDPVTIQYGLGDTGRRWDFGKLNKRLLKKERTGR